MRGRTAGILMGGGAALVCGANLALGPITNSGYGTEKAQQYLEGAGYTGVSHTDTDIFFVGAGSCGKGDAVAYEFSATDTQGVKANMVVCKGLFNAASMRRAG